MALIYFDGYDQYAPVAAPTAAVPITFSTGQENLTTVATDPSIYTSTSSARFCRFYGEDRVWRFQNAGDTNPTYQLKGNFTYNTNGAGSPYGSLSSGARYGVQLDTQDTLTNNKKIVVGYKNKVNRYSSHPISGSHPHLLAAFSRVANFTDINEGFGIILEGSNVYISGISNATYGYQCNRGYPTGTAITLIPGQTVLLGASNFVAGTNGLSTATPPIEQLAYNTVEIEVTAEGKVTCWINNLYVGSVTFSDPTRIANMRYVKIGMFMQIYTGSAFTSYGWDGVTDVYCLNGLGTRNVNRLGKVKVVSRLPTTDASVQFTRPDTSNSNAAVAGQNPPQITPSLIGVKEGDTDLYAAPAFNFTNEAIIATSVTTTGYKTDPSGNDIAPVLSVTGTNYVGETNIVPISSSLMKSEQHIYELNPKTGLPFVKSDLDATTFGVTVVAPASGG